MMPFYRYTDPSSYQMPVKQVPLMHYHVPSTEAVPVPIGDQSESARVYQPWPYYGHNIPYYYYSAPCHSCFNHGNYPCNYSYGYHPPVPETIPVQYVYPPPYLLQQPIYDYQRGFPRDYHCCGCSNYTHDQIQRGGSRVKVEEQATDADKGRDSLVPLGSSNNAFPVVLIPNDHTKNKEKIKPMEKDVDSEDKAPRPRDMEPSKDLKQSEREQRVSNGWIPFDVEGLKSLMMMGEDGNQNEVNGNKPGQFPFPIIWLPSFNNKQDVAAKAENHRTEDYVRQTSEHWSPAQSLFPVKLPDNGNSPIESQGVKESHDGKAGSETKEKKIDHIQIPVKQRDQHGEKICPVYVDDIRNEDDHVAGKASGTSLRRQSSSPKSSKLPPVCLRVDPLTKKKNGIGTSRSPSPPKSKSIASELSLINGQDLQGRSPSTDEKEVDTKRKEINVLKVVDGRKRGKGDDDGKAGSGTHIPVVVVLADEDNIPTKEDIPSKEVDYCAVEDRDTNETTVSATSTVNGEVRKKLSNEEASLLIQSAYRGYDVRRWEPLKKLKQIANVREEVAVVRNWIHALESPDFREDDKQILVVGEMIMGLLLKLDTVQGLHPSLRDFRKSLAIELVSLQEKLDSLKVEKSKKMAKNRPCARHELDAGDTVNLGVWRNIQTGEQPGCDSSKDQGGEIPNPLHADDDLIIFEDGSRDAKATADVAASTEEANTDGCLGEFSSGEVLVTDNQHGGCVLSGAEQVLKASADCSSVQDVEGTILLGKSGGHSWDGQGKDDDGVAKYVCMENYELKKLPQGSIDQNFEQLKPSEMERTELIPIGETNPALDKQIDKILEDPAAIDKEENIETETSVLTRWRQVEQNLLTDLASPATAVGRLETDQEISKEILIAELLRGEHDMDEQIKCEMPGKQEQEVLYYNDAASSVKVVPIFDKVEEHPIDVHNGSSFIDEMKDHAELELETADERLEAPKHVEVPAFVEVKEQPVEVLKGNIFGDEVIDCKEVGTEDVHEDPESAMPEEAELVEVDQEDKHLVDFEPEKMLQHMPVRQEETDDETRVGGNDNDEMQNDSQVKEPPSVEEVHIADKPVVNSEDAEWIQKGQQHQLEMVSRNGNNWENYPSGSENKEKEMKFPSNIIMNAKDVVTKETALSTTTSSIGRQLSVDDEKLVEENRRLRETMEKLMEAGQQQLTVISNLTGRVKDLERKLSQKRRGKARRCRTATLNSNRAVKV